MARKQSTASSGWAYLLVIVMVAAVAIIAFTSKTTGLEGASVHNGPAKSFSPNCVDNDDKNDYGRFGTVHLGNVEYYDYCLNEHSIKQWYCSSSNAKKITKSYRCPNGCLKGVCK